MNFNRVTTVTFNQVRNSRVRLYGLCIILLVPALIFPSVLQAEIYKWEDENGNVQFGDKPGNGVISEKVEIKEASPARTDPESLKRKRYQQKYLDVMEEERREREEQKKQAREEEEKERETRQKNCAKARHYKRNLDASGPIYDLDEEGNRVYLTEEENKAERQRAVEMLKKYCG